MNHSHCKVLGSYCWDHRIKTSPIIPGWEKGSNSDGPFSPLDRECSLVVWADGTVDPYKDKYNEIAGSKKIRDDFEENVTEDEARV